MKTFRHFTTLAMACVAAVLASGCTQEVKPGTIGRINTRNGWQPHILKPGRHSAWGHDRIYFIDVTNKSFKETMKILVGGKVNLTVDVTVRVRANVENEDMMRQAFESVTADATNSITVDQLYETFLKMKAQAIPRQIFEVQPDIQTAVANSPQLALEVRKQITEMAKTTPLVVMDAEITNYDWPDTITKAQEGLVVIQLEEEQAAAKVRAELKRAAGQLQVEEANKLVELKKAEAIAESIVIIRDKLENSPGYLMWHQIRVMGEAANGPNNCFVFYPYATDPKQVEGMVTNANLSQMLNPNGPNALAQKTPAPTAAPTPSQQ